MSCGSLQYDTLRVPGLAQAICKLMDEAHVLEWLLEIMVALGKIVSWQDRFCSKLAFARIAGSPEIFHLEMSLAHHVFSRA